MTEHSRSSIYTNDFGDVRCWQHKRDILECITELEAALRELTSGDGIYYVTQERAFAPGIADGWPDVISAPHTRNGRLVKRRVLEEKD